MNNARTSRLSRSPFWMLSMILHVCLLGWLIWYGPVRDIVLERGKPKREALIRGKELEKVIEQMQKSVAEELEDRIALLKQGQGRMATNFDTLNAHFQPFEQSQKATALMRFEKYASALLSDQQALMDVLKQVSQNHQFDAAAKAGQEKVPSMISALDEVRRGVLLLTTDQTIADRLTQAETVMFEVEKPLRDISGLLGRERWLKQEIAKYTQERKTQEPLMQQAQQAYDQAKQAYDKLDAQRKDAAEKRKQAQQVRPRNNDLIKQANETYRKLHDQYQRDRHTVGSLSRKARDVKRKYDSINGTLTSRQNAYNQLNMDARLTEMLNTAMDRLQQAMTLQKQVVDEVYASVEKARQDSEVPAS
ncbi:MAG: hypothetical protein ACF8OB_01525 [Phycisphaeraceae bacterium JB051]